MPALLAPAERGTLAGRRQELGLNQADIAEACNVRQGTVSRWEKGMPPRRFDHREKLAAVLQLSEAELDEALALTATLAGSTIPGLFRSLSGALLSIFPAPTVSHVSPAAA